MIIQRQVAHPKSFWHQLSTVMPTSSQNQAVYPELVSQGPPHSQAIVGSRVIAPNFPFHASPARTYENDFIQNNH